jgi:hypothetical protein
MLHYFQNPKNHDHHKTNDFYMLKIESNFFIVQIFFTMIAIKSNFFIIQGLLTNINKCDQILFFLY